MIKTKGLYHSGIPVNDIDRAVEFYRDVLGMDVANIARDDLKGLGRADMRSGSSIVVLFQRPNPIERDALAEDGVTHQAFFVDGDDFDTAEERMRAAGVRIHEVPGGGTKVRPRLLLLRPRRQPAAALRAAEAEGRVRGRTAVKTIRWRADTES